MQAFPAPNSKKGANEDIINGNEIIAYSSIVKFENKSLTIKN
jgi:hypothetical protein